MSQKVTSFNGRYYFSIIYQGIYIHLFCCFVVSCVTGVLLVEENPAPVQSTKPLTSTSLTSSGKTKDKTVISLQETHQIVDSHHESLAESSVNHMTSSQGTYEESGVWADHAATSESPSQRSYVHVRFDNTSLHTTCM